MKSILTSFCLLLSFTSSYLQAIEIADIIKRPIVTGVQISPDGKYLALKIYNTDENRHSISIVDRSNNKRISVLNLLGNNDVGNYFWANNERIVMLVMRNRLGSETPRFSGELYAINYDGKKGALIFGHRKTKTQTIAAAEIVDRLPNDDKSILISSTPYSSSHDQAPTLKKIDVYNGVDRELLKKSTYSYADFFVDNNGIPRVVRSIKDDYRMHVETLPDINGNWKELDETKFGDKFSPLAITKDEKSIYVLDNLGTDTAGLHLLTLDGSSYTNIYTNNKVDITQVQRTSDDHGIYAIRVDEGLPKYLIFSKDYEEANILKSLLGAFPGKKISVISRTEDGNLWVAYASSDVDPGSFYLYDKTKNELLFLFKATETIKTEDMSPMEPISFPSFDGKEITGYFTKAKTNSKEKDKIAPLVLLVHGGPRARDYWGFNPEVQALAVNGFSILQINYRGSAGFGKQFMNAGNKQWGNNIQKDILAGTQWAIKEKRATADNICIMGGSFGAYSAVQSAILYPDQYACVVANAGVYDLELMFKDGDIEDKYWGDAYLENVLGTDKDVWKKYSPVYNAASIKAPIFLAHGKHDERAPFEHFKRLQKALKTSDKEFVTFVKKEEEHGFYLENNRIEYMEKVISFLKKHTRG